MIVKIRKADVLKGLAITPGWYKGYVKSVGKTEVAGDRIDQPITLAFDPIAHPIFNQEEREVDHVFYNAVSKGIGFTISFMSALMNKPRAEIAEELDNGKELDFDFDASVGKKLMFKLINTDFQGRTQNRIEAFLPFNSEPPTA